MDRCALCAGIYLGCMLPTLRLLDGTAEDDDLSLLARQKIVKIAADRSLALIGCGSCWSSALERRLRRSVEKSDDCSPLTASILVSEEEEAVNMGYRKMIGRNVNHLNTVEDPVGNVLVRKRKSQVNRRTILRKLAVSQRRFQLERAASNFCRGCSAGMRPHSQQRCVYFRIRRSSRYINSVFNRFSSRRCIIACHLKAKAISCKLSIHHKVRFKKDLKTLKKHLLISRPARRVKSAVRDNLFHDQVQTLQELIPGGAKMNTNHLLYEAADYIFFLRFQASIMQSLVAAAYNHR